MKCHYIYTEKGEKVLIPGCWPVVNSGDMSLCICRSEHYPYQYETRRYNEEVERLRNEIKGLESENAYLNRMIKKLTQKRKK